MRIIRAKDYKDMSRKAANIISAQVLIKPDCVLGLATGSTPIGAYQQLIEWYQKGQRNPTQDPYPVFAPNYECLEHIQREILFRGYLVDKLLIFFFLIFTVQTFHWQQARRAA